MCYVCVLLSSFLQEILPFTFNRTGTSDEVESETGENEGEEKDKLHVVAVEGSVGHPLVLKSWKEGAVVLQWVGDQIMVPCRNPEDFETDWASASGVGDVNSSFDNQLGLFGLGPGEGAMIVNSSSVSYLEARGLAVIGTTLYVTKPGQLGDDESVHLCLDQLKINLTTKEGGGCEQEEDAEWCAAKVSFWCGVENFHRTHRFIKQSVATPYL